MREGITYSRIIRNNIGLSSNNIQTYQYGYLEEKIKQVKYPTYAISQAENLDTKIKSFKDEKLIQQLSKLLQNLNSYRKVRGDGNCFFRALAFSYLATNSSKQFDNKLKQVKLTSCEVESIPAEFKKFYDHGFLVYMFQKYWSVAYGKFLKQNNQNPRKALIKVFDMYPFLDFIIILYFRALCLQAFKKEQENLKQFVLGKEQYTIKKYSQETQGILINICSLMTKFKIHVYQIRKGSAKQYDYDNVQDSIGTIHLLYYENHYDIIQKNEQIEDEKNYLSVKEHYSQLSKKRVQGECVSCGLKRLVYQDSMTCYLCYQVIANAQKKYQNGKLIRARCNDCKFIKQDVSQQFGLCKRCISHQNQIQKMRKQKQEQQMFKKTKLQVQSKKVEEANKQKPKTIKGKCWECEYNDQLLDSETGICNFCMKNQKNVLNKIEKIMQIRDKDKSETQQKPKKYQNPKETLPNMVKSQNYEKLQQNGNKKDQLINYDKYKLKQNLGNEKSQQISKKEQKKLQQKLRNLNVNLKIGIQNKQKCWQCNEEGELEKGTTMCKKCYQRIFIKYYCQKCYTTGPCHRDSKRCKNCHLFQKKKSSQNNLADSKQKQCMQCQQLGQLQQKTPICKKCYRKLFKEKDWCKICKFKKQCHEDSGMCKDCHKFQKQKPKLANMRFTSTHARNLCQFCKANTSYIQGMCYTCYNKYCKVCKKMKPLGNIRDGLCIQCRGRGSNNGGWRKY